MKNKLHVSLRVITVALLMNSANTFAANDMIISRPQSSGSNLYLGIKVGNADYDKADDSDASVDLFVGFRMNELLSLQGGYTTLGEPSTGMVSTEVTLAHAEVVASVGLRSDVSLYGQVGLFVWDYDQQIGTVTNTITNSDSGTDVAFGFGVDYEISSRYAVRFAVDFYALEPQVSGTKVDEDITNISIGVKFNL